MCYRPAAMLWFWYLTDIPGCEGTYYLPFVYEILCNTDDDFELALFYCSIAESTSAVELISMVMFLAAIIKLGFIHTKYF